MESPVVHRLDVLTRKRDLDELYCRHAQELRRIVRTNLTLTDDVLDDACQFAWGTLLLAGSRVARGCELRWLATTATREALRLLRAQHDVAREAPDDGPDLAHDVAELVQLRERIRSVRALPRRQQQMVWMNGLGFEYREISAATGATPRTVQRQLMKARRRLAE